MEREQEPNEEVAEETGVGDPLADKEPMEEPPDSGDADIDGGGTEPRPDADEAEGS
jgi:hypothetical protein